MATNYPKRQPWPDVLRIIGCLCVLFTHVEYKGGSGGGHCLAFIDFFGIAGFMLFFFVSGMFAFNRPRTLGSFMREKFHRIVIPTVTWSIIYLVLRTLTGHISLNQLPYRLLLLPFIPQVPQFWYLYVLMGVYFLTPILIQWLNTASRRQVSFYLVLWTTTLFFPLLTYHMPQAASILTQTGLLFYFQGYLGVMLLGYYMNRYLSFSQPHWWLWLLAVALATSPLWYHVLPLPLKLLNTYLSPNMIALSCVIFLLVRHTKWPTHLHKTINFIGQVTYGIYLMHMVVILYLVLPVIEPLHLNYWFGMPLAVTLTLTISISLVWLLSHFKWAWVLGCSLKKT